jgi:hypothetical protein
MSLKKKFNENECYGLTVEDIKLGQRYLRKNKTKGKIPPNDALVVYEMFLMGHSFAELHNQFPQYEVGQLILTAALAGWCRDRDNMQYTLRDRVQAKVVRSVIEQVDFLTAMLSVSSAEHQRMMRAYIMDPDNNPKPTLRIESIKEYKDIVETLHKLISGSTVKSAGDMATVFNIFGPSKEPTEKIPPRQEGASAAKLLELVIEDDSEKENENKETKQ